MSPRHRQRHCWSFEFNTRMTIYTLQYTHCVRSVPGSQQPLVLTCVDVQGKLNLEERRRLYWLRSCSLDLLYAGAHKCLVSCQQGPVRTAGLPSHTATDNCKSGQHAALSQYALCQHGKVWLLKPTKVGAYSAAGGEAINTYILFMPRP